MQLLPQLRIKRGDIGNQLWARLPDLSGFEKTYLAQDYSAAVTSLILLSGQNFSANQYLIIGEPGHEETEIVLMSAISSNTATVGTTKFAHARGTVVRFIPYNQVEISSATSVGGSYSVLATVSIRVDALETFYEAVSDAITKAYKIRFKNANDTTYSDYSDEVTGAGYAYNTVYSIKKRALDDKGETIDKTLTDEFLNESLWEARRELDSESKRWPFRTSFNTDIGNITVGQYSVAVPATLRNPDSAQNILGLRIGSDGKNIPYISKRRWDEWYEKITRTTVATQPTVGQTTLVLTDTRDLEDSGSITIGTNTITYTAKNNSTNTLSGIPASGTGSITATHAVGTNVWQNVSFGLPTSYTIFEDTIFFNVPFEEAYDGNNIFMDLYRTLPAYDSDADVLDEPDVDMFVSYLKFKIEYKKKRGAIKAEENSDYLEYVRRKEVMKKRQRIGQDVGFSPDNGHLQGQE